MDVAAAVLAFYDALCPVAENEAGDPIARGPALGGIAASKAQGQDVVIDPTVIPPADSAAIRQGISRFLSALAPSYTIAGDETVIAPTEAAGMAAVITAVLEGRLSLGAYELRRR